jgi:parallel beta-helix repeat protein
LFVSPGQPIQKALDSLAGSGRWIVLKEGVHAIPATLKIPNRITLAGEGLKTIVIIDKSSDNRDIMVNGESDLHDVTIRDMVVEGALNPVPPSDPNSVRSYRGGYNRGGIIFRSSEGKEMTNISLLNLTVQNCTYNGVFISGVSGVTITNCDFNENGSTVVPGPKLQHNLLLTYCEAVKVKNSRLDTSPNGCGVVLDKCKEAGISGCEIARNGHYGILVSESSSVSISGNFVEANDRSGILLEFLFRGSDSINLSDNIIQYNNGFGIESYASPAQQKISNEKNLILQ